MTKCLSCGYMYKTQERKVNKVVSGCPRCNRFFDLEDVNKYLDKYWKGD